MTRKNLNEQLISKGNEITKSLIDAQKQESKVAPFASINDPETDLYRLKKANYLKTNPKYRYKQKTLLLANRGVTALGRFLLKDFKLLLPHYKAESKLEGRSGYGEINQLVELAGCSSVLFIESKRHEMLLWIAKSPHGPTLKCRVMNIHTLRDSTFFGNCLLYSRPLIIFDQSFSTEPHLQLMQTLLTQIFTTPNNHPNAKPFVDHCISFLYFNNKIFVRHYQISPINEFGFNKPTQQQLTEIDAQMSKGNGGSQGPAAPESQTKGASTVKINYH
ncbi:bifunctional Ribosome biogenesis protein BRX1/Brix domain [Babesia duncani]|uniref:Bifunctional Ribosome biogenesis protein BRX1/Brix domain n=1 Tax=Babesia duncani TaxID=323732 RepID=A0AAD9PKZ2_9APIC|nr:bifunctional Ribosome biogenesis protein BRX1/Brix domain [Babesia duncani]